MILFLVQLMFKPFALRTSLSDQVLSPFFSNSVSLIHFFSMYFLKKVQIYQYNSKRFLWLLNFFWFKSLQKKRTVSKESFVDPITSKDSRCNKNQYLRKSLSRKHSLSYFHFKVESSTCITKVYNFFYRPKQKTKPKRKEFLNKLLFFY